MGNLSDHFNHQDFFCKCDECKKTNEYKIHLGLVGALEALTTVVNKQVKVKMGYRCEAVNEKLGGGRKSFHLYGKAAHVYVDGLSPQDVFKAAREIPEVRGLGLNLDDKTVHIDLRNEETRKEWIKDGTRYIELTPDKKHQYGLE